MYLAAAGVGRIGIVDFDVVDFTNLQRQVIHGTSDVGRKKLDSAADTMREINPYVAIDKHEIALSSENALDIFKDYDIIVDGTDNFPTRYLVNDACVLLASRMSTARFSASKDRPRYSPIRADRATAACIPSRRLRAWCRAAPRAACWAFCRGPSA